MSTNKKKNFDCTLCPRSFARLEHLQRHRRSHTKEKPFQCAVCPHAFTRSDLLLRHKRLAHSATSPTLGAAQSPRSRSSTSTFLGLGEEELPTTPSRSDIYQQIVTDEAIYQRSSINTPFNGHQIFSPSAQLLGQDDIMPDVDGMTTLDGEPNATLQVAQPFTSPGLHLEDQTAASQMLPFADFDDYLMLLDNATLPTQMFSTISQFEQPLPSFSPDPMILMPDILPPSFSTNADANVRLVNTDQTGFSRFGSRLPSLQPEELPEGHPKERPQSARPSERSRSSLLEISTHSRTILGSRLERFRRVIPKSFVLPTRHALSRYLGGYVTGFHEHLPFLHIPTISTSSASVELILAIAAVGAQYCREPEKSLQIFHAAEAIAMESIRERDCRNARPSGLNNEYLLSRSHHGQDASSYSEAEFQTSAALLGKPIETAQALLLLMAMATWFEHTTLARAAMTMRSQLESLVYDEGLGPEHLVQDTNWELWIEHEGSKRTKFIIYCFFNLHCITFDIPPLILNRTLGMDLPCSEAQWKSTSAEAWIQIRQKEKPEPNFQGAFTKLFNGRSKDSGTTDVSTLGGYILIHALVQHIWFIQQIARYTLAGSEPSPLADLITLEHALRSWQTSWARNPESSVDPLSPHGPLSFNSLALLRIAYIRINVDTGPIRSLRSWDPSQIAMSIKRSSPVGRGKRMTRAALHCAHALSIPIKLGINFVAHTQMFFWSTQHALCSLECALLLTKWLESVTIPMPEPPLSVEENKLLNFVMQMIAETEYAAPPEQPIGNGKHLSAAVVRLWAKLFRSDSIWQMIDVIGRSLNLYADMLEP